jgi:hypothetical protein
LPSDGFVRDVHGEDMEEGDYTDVCQRHQLDHGIGIVDPAGQVEAVNQ